MFLEFYALTRLKFLEAIIAALFFPSLAEIQSSDSLGWRKGGSTMFRSHRPLFVPLFFLFLLFSSHTLQAANSCQLPSSILFLATPLPASQWSNYPDLRRNRRALQGLCVYRVRFDEGGLPWQMLLLFNPRQKKGPFWFLPHDNENSAFDAGVWAAHRYGGGLLSVVAGGHRYFHGQDPNRNFGTDARSARQCPGQKAPAPRYTGTVFRIVDAFRGTHPYLALHNNANGYRGNGGSGTISMLRSTSRSQAYPAAPIQRRHGGLRDEDSMVYIAGRSSQAPRRKVQHLNDAGLNVKYEWVDPTHNDCSMSNYVLLHRHTDRYYNIETEMGATSTQRDMIRRLLNLHL